MPGFTLSDSARVSPSSQPCTLGQRGKQAAHAFLLKSHPSHLVRGGNTEIIFCPPWDPPHPPPLLAQQPTWKGALTTWEGKRLPAGRDVKVLSPDSQALPPVTPALRALGLFHRPQGPLPPQSRWGRRVVRTQRQSTKPEPVSGSHRVCGCPRTQSEGPRVSLQASKENIFGHFQMSGNSNWELLCWIYCLGFTIWGKSHVITSS